MNFATLLLFHAACSCKLNGTGIQIDLFTKKKHWICCHPLHHPPSIMLTTMAIYPGGSSDSDDWHQHLPLLEAGCGVLEAGLLWPLLHLLWSRVSRGQSGDNLINCTWAPLPYPAPAPWSRDHTLELLNIDIDTFGKLLTTAVYPLLITYKPLNVEATSISGRDNRFQCVVIKDL